MPNMPFGLTRVQCLPLIVMPFLLPRFIWSMESPASFFLFSAPCLAIFCMYSTHTARVTGESFAPLPNKYTSKRKKTKRVEETEKKESLVTHSIQLTESHTSAFPLSFSSIHPLCTKSKRVCLDVCCVYLVYEDGLFLIIIFNCFFSFFFPPLSNVVTHGYRVCKRQRSLGSFTLKHKILNRLFP